MEHNTTDKELKIMYPKYDLGLVFTRHALTEQQREEMNEMCVSVVDASDLASQSIESVEDAKTILNTIFERAGQKTWTAIFGVIPVPLRAELLRRDNYNQGVGGAGPVVFTYESFNVNRAPEGEKPQFQHNGWLKTGAFEIYH
jgi:hypothetical protein